MIESSFQKSHPSCHSTKEHNKGLPSLTFFSFNIPQSTFDRNLFVTALDLILLETLLPRSPPRLKNALQPTNFPFAKDKAAKHLS